MNTSDYAVHAFSAFSPIFQDFPRCTPSSLDFVYKAETSVQRAIPVANFHFSTSYALPGFSVEFAPGTLFAWRRPGRMATENPSLEDKKLPLRRADEKGSGGRVELLEKQIVPLAQCL